VSQIPEGLVSSYRPIGFVEKGKRKRGKDASEGIETSEKKKRKKQPKEEEEEEEAESGAVKKEEKKKKKKKS
jgi:hypothetical protein